MKRFYTLLFLVSISFNFVSAQVEGTWVMAPEAMALQVGPTQGASDWWSNSADDVTTRACFFDDMFVFNADGSFENVMDGSTWLEAWQGVAMDECGAPVAPHDGSNAATWSYDATAGTITLTGVGAHLGLPKVNNAGEITDPAAAPASITYIVDIAGTVMTVDINYNAGADGWWRYILHKTSTDNVIDLVDNQFDFFPNPASTEINVTSNEQIELFTIRDITGRVVLERNDLSTNETIDISNFSNGLYILESLTGNKKTVKKLMVK